MHPLPQIGRTIFRPVLLGLLAASCGGPSDPSGTGRVVVYAETNGQTSSLDPYDLTLRAGPASDPGAPLEGFEGSELPPNGEAGFVGVPVGLINIAIAGVPSYCTLDGSPVRELTVREGKTVQLQFVIACS